MPSSRLSIIVVDDAKFSSVVVGRALSQAGYTDIRFASSANEALKLMEERPAGILLADWLMPEMDGLELTKQIRSQDDAKGHYTYVILLTGKEGDDALVEAFDQGVDDFISKSVMNEQLVPRVYAANRLYSTLLKLMHEKHLLAHNLQRIEAVNLTDPLTGLGNRRLIIQQLKKSLRQLEARGGTLCYLLVHIDNLVAYNKQYGKRIHRELLQSIASRLQQLVRPLDTLVRLDSNQFAMLTLLPKQQECSSNTFKRLHDGLNLKAFKTSEGFLSVQANLSLVTMRSIALPSVPEKIMELAKNNLDYARNSGRVHLEVIKHSLV